ncbi:hypothetical protein F4779DRAFT_640604 [Xylariaceae sp. FL0662B]|nr:hypothetical protein F4779DRAFT_640604 [Xylariaceae sp. FL0662B]
MAKMPELYSPYGPRRKRSAQFIVIWMAVLVLVLIVTFYLTLRRREGGADTAAVVDMLKDKHGAEGNGEGKFNAQNPDLTDIVNVTIVSDHVMATTDVSRMIQIEDLVDMEKVEHLDGWTLVGIRPKHPDDLQLLYQQAAAKGKKIPNFDAYP